MMSFQFSVVDQGTRKFVECIGSGTTIEHEKDVVDLIGICADHNVDRIMLHGKMLPPEFFDLKTGFAGMILQKLVNYQMKTAAVLARSQIRGKFGEFVVETNRGHHFRVFFDRQDAEKWLLSD
jgi:hypothetical protein